MNSDSDTDSDHSQSGSGSGPARRHSDLSDSIFRSYLEFTGKASATNADLSKIQSFLTSSSSGALSCLICLERIRPGDPTWSCTSVCFSVFHLFCIQSWARQASDLSALRASTRLPISQSKAAEVSLWNCPKCRVEYTHSQIPKIYKCFCGKLENPPSDDPWILPHSCGEVCNRPLKHNCGHRCLLLCHPGPCPSCPKLVEARCFCGNVQDVRRCGFKNFSCNNACEKKLMCGVHCCAEICHEGPCPPCRVRGKYRCQCGKREEEKECCERLDFRCEEECEKMLGCGQHKCSKGCHSGECGPCPFQGKRTCPCGKRVHEGLSCKDAVPLCGATCDKMLSCGYHRCPERCHRGQCLETCRSVVTKWCRCGSLKKEVPCHQDLTCERKCQRLRDCGRHPCKRRCCDGDCPPCSEICGRKLRCKNHKCPSPCHRGACAPCPVMVTIACLCGATHFEVPCGTEMDQKPPRCRKPCPITPLCRHGPNSKPHKCHYGACHPCKLLCEEEYPCGHKCQLRCHGPKPPPNPEFTLKPKKKKSFHPPECTPGSPCPPCPELVWRSCVGQHFAADRMMVCSDKSLYSCDNLCGNPLPCGNHFCPKTCHPLKNQSLPSAQQARSEPCEVCHLPCEKERAPACIHPCPLSCHPGDCPPCKVLVKRSCHCGSMVHVFECIYYNSLSEKEQTAVRSCKGLCHRKLPYCTHLCPETCHPGQCPSPEKCSKKVTVRCGCQTLKREWLCHDVQAAYRNAGTDPKDITKNQFGLGLLPCDSNCKSKQKIVDSELHSRRPKVVEVKEPDTDKPVPKRKRRRERGQEVPQISTLQKVFAHVKRFLLVVTLLVLLVTASYYGYKGLLRLSDWMNEVEEKRQRRHPGI
ncbi:PREDICTED: NF-X1-type zinc finger protein NFXL2 isoform X2 [Fragaria vesca subsp. vesca]|uniref:NF-X1-type zinc finger protein NFXL2 isoform X2 n=1 Tax=Fragaria vesca subsp. vesca TaxID=101020 RepID=UPI0002C33027|nr:PREDICTED: NF-X1-type zinc finger protein NFXL2 isoform X2 [Fragaria vesca subsp. vesca]